MPFDESSTNICSYTVEAQKMVSFEKEAGAVMISLIHPLISARCRNLRITLTFVHMQIFEKNSSLYIMRNVFLQQSSRIPEMLATTVDEFYVGLKVCH